MCPDLHSGTALIKIQTVSNRIRAIKRIYSSLQSCPWITLWTSHSVQPSGRCRSELPGLIDDFFDGIRITSTLYTVHDHRTDGNLSFIRLVSCFAVDDGCKQFLIGSYVCFSCFAFCFFFCFLLCLFSCNTLFLFFFCYIFCDHLLACICHLLCRCNDTLWYCLYSGMCIRIFLFCLCDCCYFRLFRGCLTGKTSCHYCACWIQHEHRFQSLRF